MLAPFRSQKVILATFKLPVNENLLIVTLECEDGTCVCVCQIQLK